MYHNWMFGMVWSLMINEMMRLYRQKVSVWFRENEWYKKSKMEVRYGKNWAMWLVMEGSFSQSCDAWQRCRFGDWRDASAVNSDCCSSRRLAFESQHSCQVAPSPWVSSCRRLDTLSGPPQALHTTTHSHTYNTQNPRENLLKTEVKST